MHSLNLCKEFAFPLLAWCLLNHSNHLSHPSLFIVNLCNPRNDAHLNCMFIIVVVNVLANIDAPYKKSNT